MTKNRKPARTLFVTVGGVIVVFVLFLGIVVLLIARILTVFVEPDERGILFSKNKYAGEVLEPGYHIISPRQRVVILNIGPQTYVMSGNSTEGSGSIRGKTSDEEEFQVDVSVVYAVNPERILELYKTWHDQYQNGVVKPMTRNVTREILGQHTFTEILERQDEIEEMVFDNLDAVLAKNDLILVEYNLLDIRKTTP